MENLENFEFAIDKIKEAKERGLTIDELLKELELEMPKHMPLIGNQFSQK